MCIYICIRLNLPTFNVGFWNRSADDRKSSNSELNYLYDRGHMGLPTSPKSSFWIDISLLKNKESCKNVWGCNKCGWVVYFRMRTQPWQRKIIITDRKRQEIEAWKDFSHPTVRWCFKKINEIEEGGRKEKKSASGGINHFYFPWSYREVALLVLFQCSVHILFSWAPWFPVERTSTAKSPGRHLIDNYQLWNCAVESSVI